MSDRTRFVLLLLVIATSVTARVGGALGAVIPGDRAIAPPVTHATVLQREQATVVRYARRYLGVPYSYGGTTPRGGFDCSGFTRFVYAHFGIVLPHYSGAQFAAGRRVAREALRPGDLLFFDGLGHVGLYIGHGRFIHAPHTGARVSIEKLTDWYAGSYDGARRLIT
jgi:cell wall-associated NlpC family hydrolase